MQAPYYAVIFTSTLKEPHPGYEDMAIQMHDLAIKQEGFLGYESARQDLGITVSYWSSLEAIANWKRNAAHQLAQKEGRNRWYLAYRVRICRVEREYGFGEEEGGR